MLSRWSMCAALCIGFPVALGEDLPTTQFARSVIAGRASILIIGDSTTNPEGGGVFVPYYEGLIRRHPSDIQMCGFRTSASMGNTGVLQYVTNHASTTDMMVEGIQLLTPDRAVVFSGYTPPGYRNEFRLLPNGSLFSYARVAASVARNLSALLPNADQWVSTSRLMFRTRFVTGPSSVIVSEIDVLGLQNHASTGFQAVSRRTESLTGPWGMRAVDVEFVRPPSSRVGVEFRGDTDDNDFTQEGGRAVAWCGHMLFDADRAATGVGLVWDSVSIGGYSARDHAFKLNAESLTDYLELSPRPASHVMIWLGQNAATDEWNGWLQPVWAERIRTIAERARQSAISAGGPMPQIVLITPPQAAGAYPNPRFVAMNAALAELAGQNGWAHLDLFGIVGDSLDSIDAGFTTDSVHPTRRGSDHVADVFHGRLRCMAADMDGDGDRDFFDVTGYLSLWQAQDPEADLTGDNRFDFFDVARYLALYGAVCGGS